MLAEATTAAQSTQSQVLAALRQASAATGSDFHYLLSTAMRESSLKPHAQSRTSSAAGLFQFVSQTWLGLIKQYGAKYGLGSYADAIRKGSDGRYHADNHSDRQAILALRSDPKVSALMAGAYTNQTKSALETRLGRNVCGGELYAAHFLGPGAACRLIELSTSDPSANAAACFPQAAEANRSVFYHRDGTAKSVAEVYDWALKQPKIPQNTLAGLAAESGAAAADSAIPPLRMEPLYPGSSYPAHSTQDDLSTLRLFTGGTKSSVSSLFGSALPQAPFILTPGVVGLLASLTPNSGQEKKDGDAG